MGVIKSRWSTRNPRRGNGYRTADGYRLPTEAEWEYGARAGTDTLYAGGNELADVAWTSGNSGNKVHQVHTRDPNAWDLYDLSGNVWEWGWDWYGAYDAAATADPAGPPSGGWRVVRGGCFRGDPAGARVANRNGGHPRWADDNQGFRLARGVPGRAAPSGS